MMSGVVQCKPCDASSAIAANCAFPRAARLLQPSDFSSVFSFRQVLRGRWLNLHYRWPARLANTAASAEFSPLSARLGLVVGKKQLKRAVDRNRVKRVVRDSFRHHRANLPPVDLVVRLTNGQVPLADGAQLHADCQALWARLCRRVAAQCRDSGTVGSPPDLTSPPSGA